MILKQAIYTLIIFLVPILVIGQTETYTVTMAPFSSTKYDEFSPVYYNNGIVYCTNRASNRVLNYSTGQNTRLFKINYIDTTGNVKWQKSRLLSKNLKSKFNDGPVTFNNKGDTIYYSRNLKVKGKLGDLSSVRNKLGIFHAVLENGKWTKVREMRFNNEWYNVTTPYLSPDGKRLYFASDKPGGFGGSDLYYCQWNIDYWEDPENLGPVINTSGNESYPFINPSGELFFSSDGHPGLGGKDIFFSRFAGTEWLTPVRLDVPVNSPYDDFGIITDTLMNEGYFSSNRNNSIDIFHFTTNFPQIFYSNIQRENHYCFMFSDYGSIVVDTLNLQYKWYFEEGKTASGAVVNHCFPGPGNYNVRLDIVERGTGKIFFSKLSYNLELRDYQQPYINSSDVVVKGDTVEFDGYKSYLPESEILNYAWDFGDSTRSFGANVKHSFQEKGEYKVNLGLALKNLLNGNIHKTGVSKTVLVVNDNQEKLSYLAETTSLKSAIADIRNYNNAKITTQYSAEMEFKKEAVFSVELFSSKSKIGVNSTVFKNVPRKFTISEKFDPVDSIYSYIVDQQMSLMATYPAYREMVALGFKNAEIKLFILRDPAEKELHNLIKIYGAFAELYFDSSDRLTSNAFIMLDQIVKLMNKYPSIRLEVAVHSDNTGSAARSLALSQRRSEFLVNYLIKRGISTKRLIATGFGGSKPIAPNLLEKDRKLNRRIDFIIINQ